MGEFVAQMAPRTNDLQIQTAAAVERILREHGYTK
jgi:hypothetical protein